tara:strand:+ start:2635 stop:3240 length:606 start_codon:yes stop_codon:yes gene_type:complete
MSSGEPRMTSEELRQYWIDNPRPIPPRTENHITYPQIESEQEILSQPLDASPAFTAEERKKLRYLTCLNFERVATYGGYAPRLNCNVPDFAEGLGDIKEIEKKGSNEFGLKHTINPYKISEDEMKLLLDDMGLIPKGGKGKYAGRYLWKRLERPFKDAYTKEVEVPGDSPVSEETDIEKKDEYGRWVNKFDNYRKVGGMDL